MNSVRGSDLTVSIVTAHGRQSLKFVGDERLIDLLARNSVPWSAVSAYAVTKATDGITLFPSLARRPSECEDISEILLYFNRNVNPYLFSLDNFKVIESDDHGSLGTEYFYQKFDNSTSQTEVFLKRMSPDECRSAIADRVSESAHEYLPYGATLVVGVSGGGDSNALLYGLSRLQDHGLVVRPVIIKGIPDWDLGVPRALELCSNYGLKLEIVEEDEVKKLLGINGGSESLIDRFEREFKGDDFEFLGTLLIRLALIKKAEDFGTKYICTGLNLEDVLCEALFRISSGLKPAAFPTRAIGDTTLLFPLWLCPKRIIDGCFPAFSLENYNARYPCFSLGRNLYYSVVYALQSQFPGYTEHLVKGISKISMKEPIVYIRDEQLGFHVERLISFPLREKFQRMIGSPS
jgi:hypothetical protein